MKTRWYFYMHKLWEFTNSAEGFCKGRTAEFCLTQPLSRWLLRHKIFDAASYGCYRYSRAGEGEHVFTSTVSSKCLKDPCDVWMEILWQVGSWAAEYHCWLLWDWKCWDRGRSGKERRMGWGNKFQITVAVLARIWWLEACDQVPWHLHWVVELISL